MGEGTITLHIHITFRMKRTRICLALATLLLPALSSEAQVLTRGKSLGTHPLSRPLLIDSVNLSNTAFDLTSLIKRPYQSEGRKATPVSASTKGFIAVPKSSAPSAPASLSVCCLPYLHQGEPPPLRSWALCPLRGRCTTSIE